MPSKVICEPRSTDRDSVRFSRASRRRSLEKMRLRLGEDVGNDAPTISGIECKVEVHNVITTVVVVINSD